MRLRLLPEAESDLEDGADFYESQSPGLGTYFNDCLVADIESLLQFAGIHEAYRGFFRALSKRFPFAIYYVVDRDCKCFLPAHSASSAGHQRFQAFRGWR